MNNVISVASVIVAIGISACTTPDQGVEIGPVQEKCDMDPGPRCVGLCDGAGADTFPFAAGCPGLKDHPREPMFIAALHSKSCTEWRALLPPTGGTVLIITPQDAGITPVVLSGDCSRPQSVTTVVIVEKDGERRVLPILQGLEVGEAGGRVLSLKVNPAGGAAILEGKPAEDLQEGSLLEVASDGIPLTIESQDDDN